MDLRAPSADRHETLPRDHYLLRLDNPVPKIQGASPKKFGAKNMQNLDRFYTTSDFDREYLRNETRYPKSERHTTSSYSSRVQPNKYGKLWSTIHKVVHVSLDLPKSTFLTDYISAPRGCWLLKFLHALEKREGGPRGHAPRAALCRGRHLEGNSESRLLAN